MNVGVGRAVKMASRLVYLDFNATTPLAPEVLEAITVTLKDAWGNPSSSYRAGVGGYLRFSAHYFCFEWKYTVYLTVVCVCVQVWLLRGALREPGNPLEG